MKFGGKQTMADKVAVASKNKSGVARDRKPATTKVKPIIKKGAVGLKITKKF